MREVHSEVVASSLPRTAFGPRDLAVPLEHIVSAVQVGKGAGHKAEGVVGSPYFALLLQSVDDHLVHVVLLHASQFEVVYQYCRLSGGYYLNVMPLLSKCMQGSSIVRIVVSFK